VKFFDIGGSFVEYEDLREYIELLEKKGKLRRISKSVDHTWELACLARWAYQGLPDQERFGMLFERVEGFDIPVVTGAVGASRETCAIALGTEPDRINGLLHPVPTKVVESAPCQEVVLLD
jgi:4-hydroxy-3-polyprenylbenzoate decarboxylase